MILLPRIIEKQLKYCYPKWAEITGSKVIGKPPIRFVPKITDYDNDNSTNSFPMYLNLNPLQK